MNINKNKESFINNFQIFLEQYYSIIKGENFYDNESCVNKGRTTAESFCKTVLADNINYESTLYKFSGRLEKKDFLFDDKNEKRNILGRLKRIRHIGNLGSHGGNTSPIFDTKPK